jgi:hypothetical protein
MENFIFIVGCGHSGTTLLNKIIGNHKDVYGIPNETYLFRKSPDEIKKTLNIHDNNRKSLNKKFVCEKTPVHVYHIDDIYTYTIDPKIIIITRDGRDVFSSLKERFGPTDYSFSRWVNDNNEWLKHSRKDEFHILKYEDLVNNKEKTIKKICKFLKIEYYHEIFDYKTEKIDLPNNFYDGLINSDKHRKLRDYQINMPIYDGSNRWVKDITKKELERLYSDENFMKTMKVLGYNI